MKVKVTLIVAIVAVLAISAHARRDFNERRGEENGRERGQGRFGGRPFFGQGGRRGDGEEETEAAQQIGDGLGGSGRFDGPGHGYYGHRQGAGRPFFGDPPPVDPEQEPRNDSSEEDGRRHPHHDRHYGHHKHHHHHHHNHTEGHRDHPYRLHNKTRDGDQDRPMFETRPFRFNPMGGRPFGDRPFGRRNHTEGHQGHNETGDHPHHHQHHGHHGRHHHHHDQRDDQEGHNETGDYPHRHHDKTGDGDKDRPMFETRPFRFNPLGRKPFGDRLFGRCNGTKEGSPRRDGHRNPHGNRGRWGENESEEKEHPTAESVTTSSPPEVVEIAINEVDTNAIAEV